MEFPCSQFSFPCCWPLPYPIGNWDKTVDVSDMGPSHIINIKKEKRETDEETKQILRMLEKDDVGTSWLVGGAFCVAVERASGSHD